MLAPLLYQINTRAFLTALGLSRPATLDDVPDTAIDAIAARGFTWVWMLSVWQLGAAGREVARTNPAWRAGYEAALPDVREADIQSSGFAIVDYTAARELGGPEALARLRSRLAARGLKLMLDFVPNHMALDSLWIAEHPDYFVAGTVDALQREPANYALIQTGSGPRVLAHGRDPNFDGWPDTLQLDYTNPALCQAQRLNLLDIAEQCDGVRADMAMLLLPDVFERTWHRRPEEFWPGAIAAVKSEQPDFMFAAEVYWDLESAMHARGFDYAYDKRLYDRLRDADAAGVRDHLTLAPASYQHKLVRFLENHDEPRAAATFAPARHEAAAVLSFLTPGLKLLYDGEIEGARIRLPVQLMRAPAEPLDQTLVAFYDALLAVLRRPVFHGGEWQMVAPEPAWEGNLTHANVIAFVHELIPYVWEQQRRERILTVVNYSGEQSQALLPLPFADLAGKSALLTDLLGPERYRRDGKEITGRGLFVDLGPWRYNVFTVEPADSA